MKVRFYCDVPEYTFDGHNLYAWSHMASTSLSPGYTRIAFDVDFPPDVLKRFDVMAPAEKAAIVERALLEEPKE